MLARITRRLREVRKGIRGSTTLQTAASLGALAIMTATTAPVLERYMNHAKTLRCRGEIRILASIIQLFVNDLGNAGVAAGPYDDRNLRLLVSDGDMPRTEQAAGDGWQGREGDPAVGRFDDYLLTNVPGFALKQSGGLAFGWDGPYLQRPVGTGPWGNRYSASVGLLGPGSDYVPIIISPGPDGVLSTPYFLRTDQLRVTFGDDIYQAIQ